MMMAVTGGLCGAESENVVSARYDQGRQFARAGDGDKALGEFLWCFDTGMVGIPRFTGVRRSFLLSEIKKLGAEGYRALIARRETALARLKAGEGDFDAAADFAAINRTLGDNEPTMAVYDQLPAGGADKKALARAAYPQLVEARRYHDALTVRDAAALLARFERDLQDVTGLAGGDAARQKMHRGYTVRSTAESIEVLAGVGDVANARVLAGRLLAFDGSEETKALIRKSAERAGQADLLAGGAL